MLLIGMSGYTQIAQMIMRRLGQYDPTSRGYALGSGGDTTASSDVDGDNPYGGVQSYSEFDGFDYHLLYNDEEDMIGFTSHDGDLTWMFVFDSFGDLYEVTVTTPSTEFIIALIWENFDIRRDDPETDDKGLLTDVIILDKDGHAIKEGLILIPESQIVNRGDNIMFRSVLLRVDGTQTDVTSLAIWETDNMSKYPIDKGIIKNAKVGTGKVIASYEYGMVEGTFEVKDYMLCIRPVSKEVELFEKAIYQAFVTYYDSSEAEVSTECKWEVLDSNISITDGVIANVGDKSGEYVVQAKYQDKLATASLVIKEDILIVEPSSQTVEINQECDFVAKLQRTGKDVTQESDWSSAKYKVEKGHVSETTEEGQTNIVAVYGQQTAQGTLIVNAPPPPPPPDPDISHDYDWKFTMRWQGNCPVDVDFTAMFDTENGIDGYVYFSHKRLFISEQDQAWLDVDYTSHLDSNDREEKPEIITVLGHPSKNVTISVVNWSNHGGSLTEDVVVTAEKVENGQLIEVARVSVSQIGRAHV